MKSSLISYLLKLVVGETPDQRRLAGLGVADDDDRAFRLARHLQHRGRFVKNLGDQKNDKNFTIFFSTADVEKQSGHILRLSLRSSVSTKTVTDAMSTRLNRCTDDDDDDDDGDDLVGSGVK